LAELVAKCLVACRHPKFGWAWPSAYGVCCRSCCDVLCCALLCGIRCTPWQVLATDKAKNTMRVGAGMTFAELFNEAEAASMSVQASAGLCSSTAAVMVPTACHDCQCVMTCTPDTVLLCACSKM
jgi:hypothetical protein